jgi:conjugative relaxase-like TrwC/TraI family protein
MFLLNISASQATEYYFKEDPIFGTKSSYHGNLAKSYGIENTPCKAPVFSLLVNGCTPEGKHVIKDGRKKTAEPYHRAAIDLLLSPNKSTSIAALHLGDDRVTSAHIEAVNRTIDYIEKNFICAREYSLNIPAIRNTGNGLFVSFTHSISRATPGALPDPQLHTHVLIVNQTKISNKHRAIFSDVLYANQTLINQIYQNELARNIHNLGYELDCDGQGKWEIAGITQEHIRKFSKRRIEVKKDENVLRHSGKYPNAREAKLNQFAALQSRAKKHSIVTKKNLKESWEQEVPKKVIKQSMEKYRNIPRDRKKMNPKDYIRLGHDSIHQAESLFTRNQIFDVSLKLSVGNFTITDIEKSFYEMMSNKEIVEVSKNFRGNGLVTPQYTSQRMKETEKQILEALQFGTVAAKGYLKEKEAERILSESYAFLSKDQERFLHHVLTTKHQFILVLGDAGTGKSSALKSLREIIQREKPEAEMIGMGYTGRAAQEIQKTGIESRTIENFLKSPEQQSTERIVIIDESSMLRNDHANEIINSATRGNSRLLLLGDGKKLQELSAGKTFRDLREMKVPYVRMTNALRQQTELVQRIVNSIKDFQTGKNDLGIDDAFRQLKKDSCLSQIENKPECIREVVDDYLASDKIGNTLVITASNEDRIELNNRIRSELKKSGTIDGNEIHAKVSVPVILSGIKPYFARNYEINQQALIHIKDLSTGEKSWFDSIIIGVDDKSNSLQVLTQGNDIKKIFLRSKSIQHRISLYETQERNFASGDRIVFLKNDKSLGVQNGSIGTVEKIDTTHLHIRVQDRNRLITIEPTKFPWIDHGYALIPEKTQKSTASKIIFLADTKHKSLNKTELLYETVSRSQSSIRIFTNNIRELKSQFKSSQSITSALTPGKRQPSKSYAKENEKENER